MPVASQIALLFAHAWGTYLLIALLVLLDAVLPVVPAEAAVLAGAALAARGQLRVLPLLIATVLGAVAGDLTSYRAGRLLGSPRLRRRPRALGARGARGSGVRLGRAAGWVRRRGGVVLVAARFVPGGRTASTLAAGALGLRARRVAVYAVVGATLWSAYLIALGYAGGRLLDVSPLLLAPALAVAVALLTGAIGMLVTRLRPAGPGPPTRTPASPGPLRRCAGGTAVPTAAPSPGRGVPG
jgi:membrane-associated protein